MDGIRRGLALAVALLLGAAPARAGKGISDITVRRHANLTSVAVDAIVSGDDDSSAVLRLFQKWDKAAAWDSGMVMVRRVGTNIHEARILWMTPGKLARFYVEGRDAGGGLTTPVMLAWTNSIRGMPSGGPTFYVSEGEGNDAYDGLSRHAIGGQHGPMRTINAALRLLKASPDQGAFGGVLVAPGEYHERVTLDFGDDTAPRFLAGDGMNRDSTILCGANPWVEKGLWAPGQPLRWTFVGDSTWATLFPHLWPGSSPGDSVQLVVVGWGEYVHRKTSIRAVLDDSTWAGVPQSYNQGERSGWFWQHDTLYVKRRNGQSPAGIPLHVGYLDDLIDVRRRNWRISGLTLRFAGATTDDPGHPANPAPGLHGHGIQAGTNGTASGLVVENCRFYGLNTDAILAAQGWLGTRCDSVTVAHCIVDGLGVGHMTYGAGKSRAEENVGQIRLVSEAVTVVGNVITDGFNGLQIGSGNPVVGPRDSTVGSWCEISRNTISHTADDAIELDTSHCINTLVLGNTIIDAGHGISQVPIYTGPVFVLYNTIANSKSGGIKVGTGTTGIVWYVHNTVTSSTAGGWAIDGSPGGSVDNVHFRNNVLAARGWGWGYTIWGLSSASSATNDFNYDLIDSVLTTRLVSWGGAAYSFPQLQSALHWERNGLRASPMFADSARQDWQLSPTSPGRGRGQRITGINTSLDGPLYSVAPDIGVRVLAALTDAPPSDVVPPRFLARATPNPARGDGEIVYALAAAADVTVRLFDPAGRVAATLLDGVRQTPGEHRVHVGDRGLPPGLYFFRVRAGEQQAEGRIVILR